MNFLYVAAGGASGAVLRYLVDTGMGLSGIDSYLFTSVFLVNSSGSFIIGILHIGFTRGVLNTNKLELFFVTGLIASFTTYSGYGVEALEIFTEFGFISLIYIMVQFVVGILALILGIRTGTKVFTIRTA